jgi:hypothetical protein
MQGSKEAVKQVDSPPRVTPNFEQDYTLAHCRAPHTSPINSAHGTGTVSQRRDNRSITSRPTVANEVGVPFASMLIPQQLVQS